MHRQLSLRTRLLLGVFVLSAIGLIAADVVTYSSLRSFLIDQVDHGLQAAQPQILQQSGPPGTPGPQGGGGRRGPPAGGADWYAITTLKGEVLQSGFLVGGGAAPRLPSAIAVHTGPPGASGGTSTYLTVAALSGGGSYRLRASLEPDHPGQIVVLAESLSGVDGTLRRLELIELIATLAVLAAITGLGLWVVRLGLAPLRQIDLTAAAIAEGDLSRRVERDEQATEVGRLGHSLNVMLSQIETAFRAKEDSERRLRRFVADASHELRTPLSAVRAYAELFGRGAAARPDDLARSMAGISRESERMSLLVDDLLLLARLDEGRPLVQEPVELDALVAEAIDAARVVDPDRPLEVSLVPVQVTGDADRLRQLIDNLFANVRAHTPSASPVAITLTANGSTAVLSVADFGPGLTAEQAGQIFERFYRADASRTRTSGGVGLGLAIVAAVADAHGGTVSVSSTPGAGATFRIELPRVG